MAGKYKNNITGKYILLIAVPFLHPKIPIFELIFQ
jgi:hypothetical protein